MKYSGRSAASLAGMGGSGVPRALQRPTGHFRGSVRKAGSWGGAFGSPEQQIGSARESLARTVNRRTMLGKMSVE